MWSSAAGFFCLAYLVAGINSGVFCLFVNFCVSVCFFFLLNNILHFVAILQPVHLFIRSWTFGLLLPFSCCKRCSRNIHVRVFV